MDILITYCNTYDVTGIPNLGIINIETLEHQILRLPSDIPQTGMVGMTCNQNHVFIGLQHSEGGPHATLSPPGLLVFDKQSFQLLHWYRCRLIRDFHSMIIVPGNRLLVASTGTDDIVELEWNGREIVSEKVLVHLGSGVRADNHHVNSLCYWNSNIYITAFGKKLEGGDWSTARNGFVMNLDTGEKLVEGLEHPHSLMALGHDLAFCESRKKTLRFIQPEPQVILPGYTRGLCQVGEYIFAGTSQHRKKSKSTGKKTGSVDEESLGCTFNIISTESLQVESMIDLNKFAFEIYDLMPLERTKAWPVLTREYYRLDFERSWVERASQTVREILDRVPAHEMLLMADDLEMDGTEFSHRKHLPFLERDGLSWGPPENDAMAIEEIKRMQQEKGATYLAIAWPSFWWFDVYPDFTQYLRSSGTALFENDHVVIFKLN